MFKALDVTGSVVGRYGLFDLGWGTVDQMSLEKAIKAGTEIIGNKTNVKVSKNKVAPPFKTAQIEIRYGEGISRLAEIIDLGVEYDLLEKSGTWFSYKGEKIGQGKENARIFLQEHPEIAEELEKQIRDILVKKPEPVE